MSFFSRLFGRSGTALERELHELYTQMFCRVAGYSPTQASETVSQAIADCKEQAKAEGTDNLSEEFGDLLITAAHAGEPKSKRIVERARRDGATDEDIREWWNLPDLSRRMIRWSENLFRYSAFLQATKDKGMSPEDAAACVHKMYPIYGDPDDTSKLSGENRPLSHELRGRVDAYRETRGAEFIKEQVKPFSTYNAFVRDAISSACYDALSAAQ